MKANELRIGNYHYYHVVNNIDDRKEWDEVYIIDSDDVAYLCKNEDDNYKPIPITEEWLLKLGFDGPKEEAGKYYELKKHRVYLFNDSFEFEFNSHDDYRFNLWKSYKYVHQLQNLYFALTGEELTINNK